MVPADPKRAETIDRWSRGDHGLVAEMEGRVVGYGAFNDEFLHQGQADMSMSRSVCRADRIGEHIQRGL
jgi:hypothetical protein